MTAHVEQPWSFSSGPVPAVVVPVASMMLVVGRIKTQAQKFKEMKSSRITAVNPISKVALIQTITALLRFCAIVTKVDSHSQLHKAPRLAIHDSHNLTTNKTISANAPNPMTPSCETERRAGREYRLSIGNLARNLSQEAAEREKEGWWAVEDGRIEA